jgi:hypothetical protein
MKNVLMQWTSELLDKVDIFCHCVLLAFASILRHPIHHSSKVMLIVNLQPKSESHYPVFEGNLKSYVTQVTCMSCDVVHTFSAK